MTDQIKKVQYRKKIYELFEKLIGREMTTEEHESLKECIMTYVETEKADQTRIQQMYARQSSNMKEMAKIIYHKAWDAEILEKHILFLKKIFEDA